jgi:hypothetical protein
LPDRSSSHAASWHTSTRHGCTGSLGHAPRASTTVTLVRIGTVKYSVARRHCENKHHRIPIQKVRSWASKSDRSTTSSSRVASLLRWYVCLEGSNLRDWIPTTSGTSGNFGQVHSGFTGSPHSTALRYVNKHTVRIHYEQIQPRWAKMHGSVLSPVCIH